MVSSSVIFISFFISIVSATEFGPNDVDEQPIVTTGLGKIQGSVLNSRLGSLFYGFRGIRYAKPPINELRFKAPEPIEQWNDVFDATIDGPMCPQPTQDESDISEDCLRLNVYTKNIAKNSTKPTEKKPVLVYLHPGGFYAVSGQSKNFAGPQSLMDRDIVLVTLNYRLGSLGMISTGTKEYPGNGAFKDQVLALKWIKLHIDNFGGDPNMVTIMGYSAGAMSVTLHMISPMSTGLFHRAIVMSAAATGQWEVPVHQMDLVERQARVLNCSDESLDIIMECFKTKTSLDFANSLSQMFEYAEGNPVLLWRPVVEPDFGQERFLTDNPTRLFRQGQFARVPVIAGVTEYEFATPAVTVVTKPEYLDEMDKNFTVIAPICFLYERNTNRSIEISTKLRETFLPQPMSANNETLRGLNYLFADGLIGYPVHRFVKLIALFTRVYYYKFTYVGRFSHLYYPNDKPYGAVHHDDLVYLFTGPYIAPLFKPNDPENLLVERMTRMWSHFAQRGNPNNARDEYLKNIRWRQMRPSRLNYLNIGTNETTQMENGLFADRYKVWDELFPLPNRRRGRDSNESGDSDESGESAEEESDSSESVIV